MIYRFSLKKHHLTKTLLNLVAFYRLTACEALLLTISGDVETPLIESFTLLTHILKKLTSY